MQNNGTPKTFLITGGAGFIGSHLAEALLRAGHVVLAIDDLSTGKTDNIDHLLSHKSFSFARASISDALVMDRLASVSDVIIHLAAAVGVKLIVDRPVHTIETNVMGTQAVSEGGAALPVFYASGQFIRSLRKGQRSAFRRGR